MLIMRQPVLRRLVVLCALIWFSLSAVYFGLQYNVGKILFSLFFILLSTFHLPLFNSISGNLSGDIYINNYLIQSIGILQIFCLWLLFFGRKVVVISGCALITVIVGVVPFLNYFGEANFFEPWFAIVVPLC